MSGAVRRIDPTVADFHRLLDEVPVVLERILEPFHFRQGAGGVDADLEEGVADRNRDAQFGGEPANPHHVGNLAMDVEDVDRAADEIGAIVGIPDVFYLSKLFKSSTGLSPTAYRLTHHPSPSFNP